MMLERKCQTPEQGVDVNGGYDIYLLQNTKSEEKIIAEEYHGRFCKI